MKDLGQVVKTITESKGDLKDTYAGLPCPNQERNQFKRILKPSELAKKLFCPAFVGKPYAKEPMEKRRQFEVLTQVGRIKAVLRMTKMGYRLATSEEPSGQFNGRVDFMFEDESRQTMKVEAKSSVNLKPWDIVQGILYREKGDKIAISSINDFVEPEDWLVELVNSAAQEFVHFYEESPNIASEIHLPYHGLCGRCANLTCPYKKNN